MEHMQAVRLLELNKEFGFMAIMEVHLSHGVMLFSSSTTVYVLQGLLSRANDFLCS